MIPKMYKRIYSTPVVIYFHFLGSLGVCTKWISRNLPQNYNILLMGNMDLMHGNSFCTCRPETNQVIFGGVEGRLYLVNKLVTELLKKL
jgi:hypothetical protein